MDSSKVFSFPAYVNDIAARSVATGVVILTTIYLATGSTLILAVIGYGFVARVLAGPRFSPLGQIATRLVAPRLPQFERIVPGPPKRFAQSIGAAFSASALALQAAGQDTAATIVMAVLLVPALLEAAIGFCLGCRIFARLMAIGVVPTTVCEACNDISKRPSLAGAAR